MYYYTLYYFMSFNHDVMHEVLCVHNHSGACTPCCTVLSWLLTGLLSRFVSVVSRTSRSTLLPQVVSNDITVMLRDRESTEEYKAAGAELGIYIMPET